MWQGRFESELDDALVAAGYDVTRVRSLPVSRDGVEHRGVFRETAELVRNVLVFSGQEMDAETAQTMLDWIFAWLRTRREHEPDDVRFVSIYGPDGKSILLQVPVPEGPASGL